MTDGKKLLLDIGCGVKPQEKEGYETIGVDLRRNTSAKVICDVEQGLPFKENTFSEFNLDNVFEHISNAIGLLEELWRTGENGALIKILSPHFSGMDAHQDITHVRGLGSRAFYPFIGKNPEIEHYGKCRFVQKKCIIDFWEINELKNIKIQKLFGLGILANKLTSFYERFFCYIFPAHTIYFELEVQK